MTDTTSPTTTAESSAPGRYVVIARRYRPQAFDELVGQEHVARALQQAITSERVGHAYLFTGARGVGKTSAARILAKALNCVNGPTPTPCNECDVCQAISTGNDVDVLEIDGASNRGIDEIRQLRQNVAVRPSRVRFKIYIIDEVHMLTKEAFNALLKTLEEPPEHVKFIFATTEPQKIPITILSRCQRFDFAGISASAIKERLSQIAAAEGVAVDDEALQILTSRASGSMRDSQSLLEQLLAVGHDKITAADVNQLLGIAPAERLSGLVQHLVKRDAAAALAELDATVASGVEVGLLLDQLVGYFRDAMAAAVGCSPEQLLYALPSQAEEVAGVAKELGLSTILAIGQILDHTAARMRVSMHGRTLVEMAVVRICQLGELDELATLVAELRGGDSAAPQNPAARSGGASGSTSATAGGRAPVPAPASKKNDEGPETSVTAGGLAGAFQQRAGGVDSAVANAGAVALVAEVASREDASTVVARREDPAHTAATVEDAGGNGADSVATAADSVLAQFQRAMAEGVTPRATPTRPARPSRREQAAKAAEHPFVRKAMELFDAPPDKLRYTPPDGEGQ